MDFEVDHLLKANEPLRHINAALSDLIEESPYITHLKDAQTGKYIQCNDLWAKSLGLDSANDIVGLTYNDWCGEGGIYEKWNFSSSFMTWKDTISQEMKSLESQADSLRSKVDMQCFGFTPEGFILFEKCIKIPLPSKEDKKTVAILTCSQNKTSQYDLFDLLSLYRRFYPEEKAIKHLLMYLKMDVYFIVLPTLGEIKALFKMSHDFDCATKTGDTICSSLQNKIEADHWYEILNRLRAIQTNIYEYSA